MSNTKINRVLAGIALATALSATSAQAGFFLEGLKPFAGDYCRDADPTLTDPLVTPPAIDWSKTSPDASTLDNRPAYEARNCIPGKFDGGGRYIKLTPTKPVYKVPQK